jgi:septal ring factor EnvC (AmiA/AmiB activator)
MAKEPDNLVIRNLRDIQSTLADHGKTLADHTKRFEIIEQRLADVHDGMLAALGLASHAHVRDDAMKKEISDIKKRLKRLEAKR